MHFCACDHHPMIVYKCIPCSCKCSVLITTLNRNKILQRVNNICFCYVAISDDISAHADFLVDGYHGY